MPLFPLPMNVRTCPHCNCQYSFRKHIKYLSLKSIWSKWNCHYCKNPITFYVKRRLWLATGISLLGVFNGFFMSDLALDLYWKIALGILSLGAVLLISGLDAFKKA